jgi:exodeoxyribonuclease VII large subunit
VAASQAHLEQLRSRLGAAIQRNTSHGADTLKVLATHLQHLNPRAVLGRGYSIARLDDGRVVRSYRELEAGAALRVDLADGWAATRIEDSGPADPAPGR